jgi:hypothetical protein
MTYLNRFSFLSFFEQTSTFCNNKFANKEGTSKMAVLGPHLAGLDKTMDLTFLPI